MITFSVLVPVFNVEKYIKECIESVLRQTNQNFELILVDDGSQDKSGEICDEYARKDSRIRVFHKENQGLMQTRRFAIEKASGDYYVFVDSDDKLKKNALETIERTFRKYHCDCVIYGYERVSEGKVISQSYDPEEVCLTDKTEICKKCFFDLEKNSLCRKAVKADVFHGMNYSPYYHLQLGEDLFQSLEIYQYSRSIAFIPDILYEYRMNLQSLTHEKKKVDIDFTIRKKVLEFLEKESGFSEEDFKRYRDFCIGLLVNTVIKIVDLDESRRFKKLQFEEIRRDPYYQNFLRKGLSNRRLRNIKTVVAFYLFKYRWDGLLIIVIRSRKVIRICSATPKT